MFKDIKLTAQIIGGIIKDEGGKLINKIDKRVDQMIENKKETPTTDLKSRNVKHTSERGSISSIEDSSDEQSSSIDVSDDEEI